MRNLLFACTLVAPFALAGAAFAQQAAPGGLPATVPQLYVKQCAQCHDHPDTSRAPGLEALRAKTPEAIYAAMTTGPMQTQASALTDDQKKMLAAFLSGRTFGVG